MDKYEDGSIIQARKSSFVAPVAPPEMYGVLLESFADPMYLKDREGRIVWANKALFLFLSLEPEKVIGVTEEVFFIQPEWEQLARQDQQVLENEGMVWGEGFVSDYYKTLFRVIIQKSLVSDSRGTTCICVVLRDVTALRKIENDLMVIGERLRLAMDAAQAGIWVWDLLTGRLFWDDRMQEIYGIPQGRFPGTHEAWRSRIHPDDLIEMEDAMMRAVRTGGRYDDEYRILGQKGEWRQVQSRAVVVRDGRGRAIKMAGLTVDVTHQRGIERKLREQEQEYRTIFESVSDGIIICDVTGKIVAVNPAAVELYGYDIQEFTRLTVNYIVHLDSHRLFKQFQREVAEGHIFLTESTDRRRDGSTFYSDVRGTSVLFRGKPHLLAVIRDITERKKTEEAQRQRVNRAERYRKAIVDVASQQNLLTGDFTRAIQTITEAAAEALTCDSVSVWSFQKDRSLMKCLDRYDRKQQYHQVGEILTLHAVPDYLDMLTRKRAVAVEFAETDPRTTAFYQEHCSARGVSSLLDAGIRMEGRLVGMVRLEYTQDHHVWEDDEKGFAGEITDQVSQAFLSRRRQETDEKLRWRLRLNQVLSSLYQPLVAAGTTIAQISQVILERSKEMTGSRHGFVAEIDPESRQLVPHTLTSMMDEECEVSGSDCRITFPPNEHGQYPGLWGHALNERTAFFANQASQHPHSTGIPSGHMPIRNFLTVPVLLGEELVGQIALANASRDYTNRDLEAVQAVSEFYALAIQRLRTEKELQLARIAAEESSLAKSRFLANMSHEIRTPLNGIMGMIDLVRQKPMGDQEREHLELARESAQSLLLVINDILDFSRIEAGRMTIRQLSFDLHKLIVSTIRMMGHQATSKGLRVVPVLPEAVPPLLVGDPDRLRQVLINLIGNALKFTEKGTVTVETKIVADSPEQTTCQFMVQDTGIGIPREKIPTLFQSFSQVDDSFTRSHGGSGLGLAISQGLVHMMGGTISLESELGVGSTFSFTLTFPKPSEAEQKVLGPVDPGLKIDPAAITIMVVEDNPINQKLMQAILARQGFPVIMAGSGKEALRILADHPVDLILMDVQMPEMDGLEATRLIRQREEGKDKRAIILALTAHAMEGDRDRCLKAGMDGYLSKPVNIRELLDTINRVMQKPRDQ